MLQVLKKLVVNTTPYEIIDITQNIFNLINRHDIKNGLLNLSILHTSCSLMIQENADPNVLRDVSVFLKKLRLKEIIFTVQKDLMTCQHT